MFTSNDIIYDLKEDIIKILSEEMSTYIDYNVETRAKLIKNNKQLKEKFSNKESKNHLYRFYNTNGTIKLDQSIFVPKGFYCYPLQFSILRSNSYELHYISLFPSFEKFKNNMKDISLIIDYFHVYPNTTDSLNGIANKNFWLWVFITLLSRFHSTLQIDFNEENQYKLISYISTLIDKDPKHLYRLYSKYLHYASTMSKTKERVKTISNYRNSYCVICDKYFCTLHFYNLNTEKVYHGIKIVKSKPSKLIGQKTFICKKNLISDSNDLELSLFCTKNTAHCRYKNMELNDSSSMNQMHYELFSTMNKEDFFNLNLLLTTGLCSNSCFVTKLFNYKYKCSNLYKIISIISKLENDNEINNYLKHDLFGGKVFPKLTKERVTFIYDSTGRVANTTSRSIKLNTKKEVYCNYVPCSHQGECKRENCDCYKRGGCEKFCFCPESCSIRIKGCKCKNGCPRTSDSNDACECSCIKMFRECDPDDCPNCTNCHNMKIYNGKFKTTIMGRSRIVPSNGLFSNEDIKQYEVIGVYDGEIVENKELERRNILSEVLETNYSFSSSEKFDVDALRAGNSNRYINHSSFGYENVFAKKVFVRGVMKIVLFAKRDIPKGAELYFDYQMKELDWVHAYNQMYGNK